MPLTSTSNSNTNQPHFDKLRSISPGIYPPSMHMGLLTSPTRGNMGGPILNPHPNFPYTQQWRPNLFPFGLPFGNGSPGNHNLQHPNLFDGTERSVNAILDNQKPRKPHIKKPLNAFMLFMKEQRPHVIAECVLKESSQINKVLGQKWKQLPRSEQDKYYEMAKEERIRHMKEHPGWSARDNYGIRKKRTQSGLSHKKPREKLDTENGDCVNQKKCRARFGLEQQGQWCKHCKRKKKCTRFTEEGGDGFSGSGNLTGAESSLDEDDDLNDRSRDSNEENRLNLTLTNNHNVHSSRIERSPQGHSHHPQHRPHHLENIRPPPHLTLLQQPQFFH
ncbi:unnamed protein product [Didymodactylos carnosus]|nr:unnamed protein product [Didymodactylos carnosus]CAF3652452.1 unnamed protein product [Didymodactylos carnosus]